MAWDNEMIKIHTNQFDLLGGPGLPSAPFEITEAVTEGYNFSGSIHAFPICFILPFTSSKGASNDIAGCLPTQIDGAITFSPVDRKPKPRSAYYKQDFYSWTIIYLGPGSTHTLDKVINYPFNGAVSFYHKFSYPKGQLGCSIPRQNDTYYYPDLDNLWDRINYGTGFPPWNYCMYNTTDPNVDPYHNLKIYKWNSPNPNKNFRGWLNKYNQSLKWTDDRLPPPLLANKLTDNGWVAPVLTYKANDKKKVYSQPHLWKAIAALRPVILHRPWRSTTYIVKSCIQSPYAFLLAYYYADVVITVENDLYKVKCYNCTLTNCLTKDNGNIKIMLIVRQPPYVMIPVNITGDWYDNQGTRILQLLNNQLFRPKRFVAALILGITALISVIASLTVSTIALTKEVHTATFADQLSKNVTLALTTQEIIDRKLNDKVDALEEAVLAIGQELLTLKIKLALRCHSDFKWICVTPLQVNHSIHTWNKIKNHLEGVWNHSDLSLDITKLHQEIFAMSEGEKAFSAQDLSSQLYSGFKGLVNHSSWLTFFII